MTAITLHLNGNDARLMQLALAYLVGERKRAVKYAEQIAPESRADFLHQMDADKRDAREISHRIDAALDIRRRPWSGEPTGDVIDAALSPGGAQ